MPAVILRLCLCALAPSQQYIGLERSGSLPPEVKAGPSPPPVSPLPWQSLRGVRQPPAQPGGSARPAVTRTPAPVDRAPSRCTALRRSNLFHGCGALRHVPRTRPHHVIFAAPTITLTCAARLHDFAA